MFPVCSWRCFMRRLPRLAVRRRSYSSTVHLSHRPLLPVFVWAAYPGWMSLPDTTSTVMPWTFWAMVMPTDILTSRWTPLSRRLRVVQRRSVGISTARSTLSSKEPEAKRSTSSIVAKTMDGFGPAGRDRPQRKGFISNGADAGYRRDGAWKMLLRRFAYYLQDFDRPGRMG